MPKSRTGLSKGWYAYRLRLRRRGFLLRAVRKRRELAALRDRTAAIESGDVLCFATVRNEAARLRFFLAHHRALGVAHFLIVVNDSSDGTADFLAEQQDVSVWTTDAGYKGARFGMDWINALMMRYGHGHWCLTVDADELFIYPQHDLRSLADLTADLDAKGRRAFGAMMLDMYPQGPLGAGSYAPGQDPVEVIPFFDAANYRAKLRSDYGNLWVQGGPRERVFFAQTPDAAPTLSKVPLVKWNRRYAYVSSTHSLLPRRLNAVYGRQTGVLLHTKFLPEIIEKSRDDRDRGQHFANSALREEYYAGVIAAPTLWHGASVRYEGWEQLVALGLMSDGA